VIDVIRVIRGFFSAADPDRTNRADLERRLAYRRKRSAFRDAGVNLVEIDLIRDGEYLVPAPEAEIPESPRAPYVVSIWRAAQPAMKFRG
jgi:hypothetical protein